MKPDSAPKESKGSSPIGEVKLIENPALNPVAQNPAVAPAPAPRSWWQSSYDSVSAAGSYIGSSVSSAASATWSGVQSVFSSIADSIDATVRAAEHTAHVVSPFVTAVDNLQSAMDAVSAPATQLRDVVQNGLPQMAHQLNQSLTGRPRRQPQEQKSFLADSALTQITHSIPRYLEMQQRQAQRQEARAALNRSLVTIRQRVLLSIQQLRSLQGHLQALSTNLRTGKDRLNESIARGRQIDRVIESLQRLIPVFQNNNVEAVLTLLENFAGNQGQDQTNFEQFNRMLDRVITLLQSEEEWQSVSGLVERLHQVSVLTDTIDAFAEAASQYSFYSFLRKWGMALGVSSSVILTNQINSYWRSTFIVGESNDYLQPGFMYYAAYANLAMAGASAVTGFQGLNRLSLRQMRVDFDHLSGLMNQLVSDRFSAVMQRALAVFQTDSRWTPDSLAARSRLYHFMLRNLLDQDENLHTLLQNVFLNLTIKAIEKQIQRMARPIGNVISTLSWSLLMPLTRYQEAASGLCPSDDMHHLYTIYHAFAYLFGRYNIENRAENTCEEHYLFEYQIIAPLLYLIELAAFNHVVGKTVLPYLAGQYSRYQAQNMLLAWNTNDRLANQIRGIIETSLHQAMFNEDEQPLPAQHDRVFNTSTLLEGMVGVGTQQLVLGLHEEFDRLGAFNLDLPSITRPPEPLNRVHRRLGQSVDSVVSLGSSMYRFIANAAPRVQEDKEEERKDHGSSMHKGAEHKK